MRLVTYVCDGQERVGALVNGDREIVDLSGADPRFATMLSLIESGDEGLALARARVEARPEASVLAMDRCRLLAPLPRPTQIRDCLTFPDHLKGGVRMRALREAAGSPDPEKVVADMDAAGKFDLPKAYYEFPVYYISNRMAVVGPDVDVEWPPYSKTIDYEMEWAAVIGRECRGVGKADARRCIFGYTVFNDWSARDEQMRAMNASAINLGPARGKDFCNGVGPCIATADEFDDPYDLDMIVRINGIEESRGSTGGMFFKFEDLIAFLSEGTTIYPGELICSGTVGGGCTFETGRVLKPGDVIELEVEGIGSLRNRVVAPHMS